MTCWEVSNFSAISAWLHPNARNLSNQLRAKSFSSDVETFSYGGVEQFRVLVGNFVTRSEATKFATQLSENEKLPVYVRLAVNR